MAAAEAVTAALEGVSSPLFAVANRAVDTAPRPVKEWAIETLGAADKAVLVGGVVATVAMLAFLAGAVGAVRPGPAVVKTVFVPPTLDNTRSPRGLYWWIMSSLPVPLSKPEIVEA